MTSIEKHYQRLAPRLTNWLVATGSTYADACDLVQNVFLKIWQMRDDLRDDDAQVSGLAFTIARNLRKNLLRDTARERVTATGEMPEVPSGGPAPGENADAEYRRRRVAQALAALPPILREAYTLFQIGEMSIREIALQTGVSENLVKVRIHRAKCKLRELLADLKP